jgi:hypothetical protein
MSEGIVFIEHCTHDDEDSKGEKDTEEQFFGPGEFGGYK